MVYLSNVISELINTAPAVMTSSKEDQRSVTQSNYFNGLMFDFIVTGEEVKKWN